jgi:predicted dehydrogenase
MWTSACCSKQARWSSSALGARPKLYTDLRQLLEDKAVDAVSTATPNHWHALLTIWACQAGKDVYVEKPACWSFEEGEKMIEAARKYNRIVQVGHQTRSDPVTRLAVQRAWAGEIGKIYMSRGLCYKPRGPIGFQKDTDPPPWLHWELWQGPATRRPFNPNYVHYNWHWFWNYGNGDIGNQGVHQVDIARWFLNKRYPVKVHSVGGRYGYEDQGETPNTQIATFEYEDGTLLVFEVRGLFTNDEQGAKIGNLVYGSLGYMSSGDGYKPRRSPQEELPEKENCSDPNSAAQASRTTTATLFRRCAPAASATYTAMWRRASSRRSWCIWRTSPIGWDARCASTPSASSLSATARQTPCSAAKINRRDLKFL